MAFENGIVDFRSDTVTHPTQEMRQAMSAAPVGDDVYGEDPTINELERRSADLLGMEDALFTASGTMGNLIAVLVHCQRGDEAVMGTQGHTFLHEVGGISALGGVFPQLVPNEADGTLSLENIRSAIREDDIHHPDTRLFILENTQNSCGGNPISAEYMQSVSEIIKPLGIKLHVDGARIFNAGVALNLPVNQLVQTADSVMFCLSKGLCAPIGSMLCGSESFISRARKIRKQVGGGMRQAGIIGAAGLIAIEKMTQRLNEDHIRAKNLAEGMKSISGIKLENGLPLSNMVYIRLNEGCGILPSKITEFCRNENVWIGQSGPRSFRFVTHYWIDDNDIGKLLTILPKAIEYSSEC